MWAVAHSVGGGSVCGQWLSVWAVAQCVGRGS